MTAKVWTCPVGGGGADTLRLVKEQLPSLGPNDVLVRHKAIGVNFMDVYFRSGFYPNPSGRLGGEAAGVVERTGGAVENFRAGDRVAYGTGPIGAYSDARVIDARHLVSIPDDVEFRDAAAALLKGMTAAMLVARVVPVTKDDRVLVHAAAGGVGQMLGQWLQAIGAFAIGVVGGPQKMEQARRCGYALVIDRQNEDVAQRVAEVSGGNGVEIVFDGVGKETFDISLASLAMCGTFVSFGAASGAVSPFSISSLAPKALFLTRPTLAAYTRNREQLCELAGEVFRRLGTGGLHLSSSSYSFDQIPAAHFDLDHRRTSGSVVIEL